MEFDESKILTAVTAEDAEQYERGWFADSVSGLQCEFDLGIDGLRDLTSIKGRLHRARFATGRNSYCLFYPYVATDRMHRPYRTVEDAEEAIGRVVIANNGSEAFVVHYITLEGKDSVIVNGIDSVDLCKNYHYRDGSPVGISLESISKCEEGCRCLA